MRLYGSDSEYVKRSNTVGGYFCLYPVVKEGKWADIPRPEYVTFTVNGQDISSDNIHCVNGSEGSYYRVYFGDFGAVSFELSDRTTYSITVDRETLPENCRMDLSPMPSTAVNQ